MEVFALAMTLHPDAMRRAQEQIDKVVSRDRPPTFENYADLPYIQAIVREIMRRRPVLPLVNGKLAASIVDITDRLISHSGLPKRCTKVCSDRTLLMTSDLC